MNLTAALSDINLMVAQAKALELLQAWRAGNDTRVAEIREELLGAYSMFGLTDAGIWTLVKWCIERGL